MDIFHVQISKQEKTSRGRVFSVLKSISYPAFFLAMLSVSVFFAYAIKVAEIKAGILILGALIGPVFAYSMIAYPKFGIIVLMILTYVIFFVFRALPQTDFPMGTILDAIEGMLLLGLFIKLKYRRDWSFLKSPISVMIIIWVAYNILEVVNPTAESRLAWVYTVRTIGIVMLMYFVFSYHIRTLSFVRLIINVWLWLSFVGAIYGIKQQFIGFTGFEERYLYSNPVIMDLLFINGVWRKFSVFSDPVLFSYNMVMSSLLCVALLFGPVSKLRRWGLSILIFLCLLSMLFSGTRGAFVLFPAGMIFLAVICFNKRVLIYSSLALVVVAVLILMPTSNQTIYRFQSAFKPSDDPSFNLRKNNQKFIQPFIQTHPIGGGLGATGVWGTKFAPNSFLAKFPPDSGYVRVAVELGWIGLLLFCTLLFIIMKEGINNYFRMKDPELRSYCLGMILIIYAIAIGSYPQEAISQFPSSVYFLLVAALINITYKLDKEKNADLASVSITN